MLPLAHLGIGSNLVRPWWKKLDLRALLFGTLLPDLIDKPLYHVPALLTGLHGIRCSSSGCSCSSRSFREGAAAGG
jgi:hypothetical protein